MRGVTRGFWAQASSPAICIPTFVKQHARTLNGGCGGGRCQTKETLPLPDKRRCRERWWWWWSWWRWWRVHNYTPDPAAVLSLVCVHVRACVVSCVCTSVSLSLSHTCPSALSMRLLATLSKQCVIMFCPPSRRYLILRIFTQGVISRLYRHFPT